MSEEKKPPIDVILYICPRATFCGGYYAAPEYRPDRSPDLASMQTRRSEDGTAVASFSRLECPRCRERGIHILRVPFIVTGVVTLEAAMQESGVPQGNILRALGREPMPTIADKFDQ